MIDKDVETYLVTGLTYRIKMRAKNQIGFGEFSEVTQVALVNPPSKVSTPYKVD